MTIKLYLDSRFNADAPSPIKVSISKNGKTAYITIGIKVHPSQWDKKTQLVSNHPQKTMLNNLIQTKKLEIERKLIELGEDGKLANMSAFGIKDLLTEKEKTVSFLGVYDKFVSKKSGRTKEIYQTTRARIIEYDNSNLRFEDITPKWIEGFFSFMEKRSPAVNARNIHLRNIRAVFNYALCQELTNYYPFRKVKIRNTKTKHRHIAEEDLIKLWNAKVLPSEEKFLDTFKLMFFLIGINTIDLFDMKIRDGRVEYTRAKTSKDYSVKLLPEAKELLEKLKGKKCAFYAKERYTDYRNFTKRFLIVLKRICEREKIEVVTSYWARHTWATMAHRIGIDKDTISLALGHSFGARVTDVYVDYDLDRVDRANEKVASHLIAIVNGKGEQLGNDGSIL